METAAALGDDEDVLDAISDLRADHRAAEIESVDQLFENFLAVTQDE